MNFPTSEGSATYNGQTILDSTDLYSVTLSSADYGVLSGCAVTPSSGMTVAIASGTVAINGVNYAYAGGTQTITTATTTGDRRDIIYLTPTNPIGSDTAFTATIGYLAGTANTTPQWSYAAITAPPIKPNLPANAVLLAEIYVQGGTVSPTTSITTNEIVDKRIIVNSVVVSLTSSGSNSSTNTSASNDNAGSLLMSYGHPKNGGPEWVNFNIGEPVQAVSVSNIPGTYAVGGNTTNDYPIAADTFTVTATGALVIDGQSISLGQRILLAGQSNAAQNGVYVCTTAGTTGVSAVFCRDNDTDTAAKLSAELVQVYKGTVFGGTMWHTTFQSTGTLGTDPVNFYLVITSRSTSGTSAPPFAGFKAFTVDPAMATSTFAPSTGANSYYQAIWIPSPTTISTISFYATGAVTGANVTVGIYNATTRQAYNSTALANVASGLNTVAISSANLFPGLYFIGITVAGTAITLAASPTSSALNFGATATSGQLTLRSSSLASALAASIPSATPTAVTQAILFAIS